MKTLKMVDGTVERNSVRGSQKTKNKSLSTKEKLGDQTPSCLGFCTLDSILAPREAAFGWEISSG